MRDLLELGMAVLAGLGGTILLMLAPRALGRLPIYAAVALAGAGAVAAVDLLQRRFHAAALEWGISWLPLGDYDVRLGCYVDRLALVMLACVAVVAFLVQIYALWYMKEDASQRRFVATLAFFTSAMAAFVVSANLLIGYVFWELIGFASYLLIGFWHQEAGPRRAAIKAFVMTRFGDLGFLAAIIVLLLSVGTLEITALNGDVGRALPADRLTLVVVLLLIGVAGKSAQFPLHTWLPDAMEGPTPVSALIHSATMVAAGVYLLVRLFPLISASEQGLELIMIVGAITALITALQALTARDMKRILAYSTVSQLGFMVMAIGAGAADAAMFHLLTHAGFKSMLFLLAGYFISINHHSNDIFDIGALPWRAKSGLMVTLLWIGGLALAGLFPFSGFLSKEAMLIQLFYHAPRWVYGLALAVTFLTAYYTMRMLRVVSRNGDRHAEGQHGETSLPLSLPVTILGVITVAGVWLGKPWLMEAFHLHPILDPHGRTNLTLATLAILLGLGAGWLWFTDSAKSEDGWVVWVPGLGGLIRNGFFVDMMWSGALRLLILGGSRAATWCDANVINRVVNAVGRGLLLGGGRVTLLQNGQTQRYLLAGFVCVALVILYFVMPGE